uniref:Tripartite motif containing 10 n=1 Tax=Panthera tigris altaica TaxID=74533 RepID=A0A8C9M4P1_PANTA
MRPNWQLPSVVDNIERLRLAPTPGLDEEDVCKEHGEKIYFFCEDDETQLCVLCREAWAHRAHTVRFLEDAAGPYREQIQKCLECLRKEREEIQRIQARENQRTQVLLSQVATKRQKVIFEFAYLSQFLEEQQSVLLAQLEALDADILRQREEFDVLVSEEMCRFGSLISELEEKNERPARGLLTDIRSTLLRCETRKCRRPEAVSPELGQRIRDFPQQAVPLQREVKLEQPSLSLRAFPAACLSLDPQTSHPKLLLSEDHQRAQFSYKWQSSPDNPERFDRATCVLARGGFTGGRHTWLVKLDLAHGGSCTVGVAREDVLGSFPTRLALEEQPRQVRVSLDYEVGWVTFANAVSQQPIYTFTASFTQKVLPFFGLWGRGSSFSLSS